MAEDFIPDLISDIYEFADGLVHFHNGFKEHETTVERINSIKGIKWEAKMPDDFRGMTMEEINKFAGRSRYYKTHLINKDVYK